MLHAAAQRDYSTTATRRASHGASGLGNKRDGRHRRRRREEREVGEVEAAKLQAEDRHIVDILAS